MHCDTEREFDNKLIKGLFILYNIKITFSSNSYSQSKGLAERFHATSIEIDKKSFSFTPYELLFGYTASPEI